MDKRRRQNVQAAEPVVDNTQVSEQVSNPNQQDDSSVAPIESTSSNTQNLPNETGTSQKDKSSEVTEKAQKPPEYEPYDEKNLEDMHLCLQPLWTSLSTCLDEISQILDSHAVLSLQHAAEAFFLAHAFSITQKSANDKTNNEASASSSQTIYGPIMSRLDLNKHAQNMFEFAGKVFLILNNFLRKTSHCFESNLAWK